MIYQRNVELNFIADEYIKYSYFSNLYENCVEKMDLKYSSCSYTNKYLLAVIVACIEGQICIDLKNKSWYFWNVQKNDTLNNKSKDCYILLNIYDFLKANKEFFDFITKYFNLWHENKSSEFIYDKFHKKDLEENFRQLMGAIKEDIKTAKNENDKNVVEIYSNLYDILICFFSYPKEISF